MKQLNGIDIDALAGAIEGFRDEEGRGDFIFRSRTRWLGGGHSQTSITGFFGGFVENADRRFVLEADEPKLLLGGDAAPNPAEHLLHALGACLTASMVYHAAAHCIAIRACECSLRGELDLRGFLGVAPEVRKGFRRIEVSFRVESDAPASKLEELARMSPVLDVVERGTEVVLHIETVPLPEQAVPEPETV